MRRTFLANTLVNPPIDERIAPGGQSSSHVLNVVLESLRDEINFQREILEHELARAAMDRQLQTSGFAASGWLLSDLYGALQTLLQNSRCLPVSFRMLGLGVPWVSYTADAGVYQAEYGLVSAPVTASRSLVYQSDGTARNDLVLHVATGADRPDGSMWVYTLGAQDLIDGVWEFPVPAGDGGRWLLLRFELAAGGFDELANFAWLGLLPVGGYGLETARVRNASGQWRTIDLAGMTWAKTMLGELPLHWNPRSTGPVDTVELLLRRTGYTQASTALQAAGVVGFDVRSLRFDRNGRFTVRFFPARQPARLEFWYTGSNTGWRATMNPDGVQLSLSRRSEWFSPMLRGITVYL